ncbi:Exodeoxyribonuclease I [Lysobacter dokdonensis DS-58]|uniref:Exodeoxyribonuclease I n=1 Tax=Lysobacter dokdonensis DS-58 TaxID=1300345 RepID=A0A0A2WKG3_9GAMM|nr:exodeoxyribonuclease I [Lysobacter dokdonensis]KGQ20308.1 Exodeoxyribonuclease I [Lysobacter dokdonensis DS-58]
MPASFLFYDLETFGSDPRRTRIAQFAALRTDAHLNAVEDPISLFVQPADDLLPSPAATMITGITPQRAHAEGVNEAVAFARIFDEMARPETCTLGYNSLRFDDEFVRCGFFRNFYDPYEREWRGGNSRWDLLDVLRMAYALRPEGIAWPLRDDGAASFRLEHLAVANDVRQGDAHEALSDVLALVGLARKLKQAQPKLWDYALRLRDKRYVAQLVDPVRMQPVLHVSQRFPALRMSSAPVVPVARHPQIDSRVIVFDLDQDPEALLTFSPEEIADHLYTPSADLPDGAVRVALKEVHVNKCPIVVQWEHLREADFGRLSIDRALCESRAQRLRDAGPELAEKVRRVYAVKRERGEGNDVDHSIYDGFLDEGDKRKFATVRSLPPKSLATHAFDFKDARMSELLFRYRARNWPETLSADERVRWDDYRRGRLTRDAGLSEYTLATFFAEITALRAAHADHGPKLALLDALEDWGRQRAVELS